MKRVYTDDRFPGYEIVNHGSGDFQLVEGGKVIAEFESWENPDGTVSEPFAARRAHDYFERWANMDMTGELTQQLRAVDPEEMEAVDHTEVFNAPPSGQAASQQIDKMMSQERMETDPERKRILRQNILNLMKQEESLAEAIVNHLVES
jgi:uncharacterized protein YbaA (DUF1428 family)